MSDIKILLYILVAAAVTLFLRVLPFVLFKENRPTPKLISDIGKYLPYAIMAMLVVYCLKEVTLLSYPYGIPELISAALVILLHIWKRNTLFSIVSGTVCYMLLVQFIFYS